MLLEAGHFQRVGAFSYPGGVPTSLDRKSLEQWDFPNGFGPLNFMVIEGLRKSENPEMQDQVALFNYIYNFMFDLLYTA